MFVLLPVSLGSGEASCFLGGSLGFGGGVRAFGCLVLNSHVACRLLGFREGLKVCLYMVL